MSLKLLYGPIKVGGDTLCYCGKCRMELAHVIVSMVDGKPAKVLCKTCKSEHRYRDFQKKSSYSQGKRENKKWVQKIPLNADAPLYSKNNNYKEGELLKHSLFGVGIVEEVKKNKIVVSFKIGRKVLVHGFS